MSASPGLHLIQGPRSLVREAVQQRAELALEGAPAGVAWGGLRRLLADLRARLGDEAFERGVAENADALSVILRRLEPTDRAAQEALLAPEDGMLTHNSALSGGLSGALREAIRALLGARVIGVPDAGALDHGSLGVLVGLALRGNIRLVLGAIARPSPEHPLWRREPDLLADWIGLWALHPGVEILTLGPEDEDPPAPVSVDGPWDHLDDRAEQTALAALSASDPLRPEQVAQILHAGELAFAAYDFHAALRLTLGLWERRPALEPLVHARLARRLALSAYNRQVAQEGNAGLAELLDAWLLEAWAGETDPAARSHLAYRLCINRARRQGDLAEGQRWGEEALALAGALATGPAGWLRAWARNGLAYVRTREGRLDLAIHEMLLAWEAASPLRPEDAPGRELAWTQVVLADNLAELHLRIRDLAGAAVWQAELLRREGAHEGEPLLAFRREIQLLRESGRLREAEEAASAGLASAERAIDLLMVDMYRVERADLRYRLGDWPGALEDFEGVLLTRARSGAPEDVDRARASVALAASRCGEAARALELLDGLLARAADPGRRAELTAAAGLALARAGEVEQAEEWMNAAIAEAVALGSRDVLIRVAVAAGEALLALGRRAEATPAFARAWALAQTGSPAPAAADACAALIGLLHEAAQDDPRWEELQELLPAGLEDAETWARLHTAPNRPAWLDPRPRSDMALAEPPARP